MPIYEYRCTGCGDQNEVMQKITDRPLRKCKKCSGKLEKLVSRTSFQLKGGGWYDQGYGASGSGSKSSSGSSKGGSSKSSESKKSDSGSGSKKEGKSATA